jgi:excisionase family DNA binding protein
MSHKPLPKSKDIQKRLLTVKEAAVYLGRSYHGVMGLIHAGKIPCVRPDRHIQIDIQDLEKFIDHNKMSFTE